MANFFAIMVWVTLILLIIGLISPKTALFWKKKGPITRKKAALVYGMAILICFFGGIISLMFKTRKNNSNLSEKKEQKINFANTTWYSQELQYSMHDVPNNLVLSFSEEKVEFDLPGRDSWLASLLLHERSVTIPYRYSFEYSSNNDEIILDPGFTGYNIHLEISGDSLIWKGSRPPGCDYISLKQTGPVKRLK